MKRILSVALAIATLIGLSTNGPAANAAGATSPAGKAVYLYHTEFEAPSGTMSDSKTFKFETINASFDFDISAVPTGTAIKIGLDETSGKSLTIDQGCCVIGGIDGVSEVSGVSYGGGVWEHKKADGERIANLKFYNSYSEFKDGKYAGLIGKLTASAWVQIGDAAKVALNSLNAKNFKLGFSFKTFGLKYVTPKNYSKLWFEGMWDSTTPPAVGAKLKFTPPTVSYLLPGSKKAIRVTKSFGSSFAAYNNDTQYYQESKNNLLEITGTGAHVYTDTGIYLPNKLKQGTVFTAAPLKLQIVK